LTARYKIADYVKFIQEIGNRWELKRQIRDVLVNTAAIECAKFTLAINLERRSELNHLLTVAVQKLTESWGIEVLNVQLQEIDLGNEIDKAQTNVSVSAINIAANKNNAQKILFDGAAEAEVHKMFQFAKAEGIKEIAAKLGVDDKAAIYQIETLANVWRKSNADLNLYGSDVQQLFGMLTTLYKSKVDGNNNLTQNNAQQ
jgi:regulator of protease activity HflC (stomatin/prohibitin superfamily)